MSTQDPLALSLHGAALIATIQRPKSRNAIDRALAERLCIAAEQASEDPAVRGLVLAAEGPVFLSGGDLRELDAALEAGDAGDLVLAMGERLRALERCAVPVVAAVTGDVFGGGCELCLLCDAVIAEEGTGFSFRHARMGLSPAWGAAARLIARVGPLAARDYLFSARRVDAMEAAASGLVSKLVPQGQALAEACRWVDQIAESDRRVVAEHKTLLLELSRTREAEAARAEAAAFKRLWGGPAHRAAMLRVKR